MCRAYGAGAFLIPAYPALTRWANLWRAYGAMLSVHSGVARE